MNGLFSVQPHEDANLYLKNFIDGCLLFDIAHISKEFVWLRIFPFSLIGNAVLWLWDTYGLFNPYIELTKAFLYQFFPHALIKGLNYKFLVIEW